MFSVEGVTWQVDPLTGDHWEVVSEAAMSEAEVEGAVGAVEDDPVNAARELIRTDVR